ncbi:MAG: hypothetical protein K9G58_05010 [Bacteroidales bacterium]|nr:hypothetical protein [Bacteroidales bacterium]MCF8386253.1 hypothetical protein [Bacteroidales bacterium]MCF8397506.1 hypothetical protein [Bacteroidales bacterium]
MKAKTKLIEKLDSQYFWDVNMESLNEENSKRLIIERVFSLGKKDEMKSLLEYYGRDEVISTLQNLNYLDPKTLNFLSKIFNKPKTSFKCYTRKQLTKQHWNS